MRKDQSSNKSGYSPLRITLAGCLFVYLCITGLNLYIHDRLVDSPALETRQGLHEEVLSGDAPSPIQYRIMVYYMAEALQKAGIGFKASYLTLRGVFLFLAALLFHLFLLRYFTHREALFGVVLLFALLPQTYIHYYMQEMDLPNLVFYLLSFLLIQNKKDILLFPLLFLAMFNRETPIFIPLIWLFCRWDEVPFGRLFGMLSGYYAVCFGVYIGLQAYFGYNPAYIKLVMLKDNLRNIHAYWGFFLLFGFLVYPALKNWAQKPKFLRRASLVIPFYIVFNLTLTIFQESRLLLPLFIILIPLAIASFSEPKITEPALEAFNPWIKRYRKRIFLFLFISAIAAITAFSIYGNKRFVEGFEKKKQGAEFLKSGGEYYGRGEYHKALRSYQQGVRANPDDFDLNYNLGILYYYRLNDRFRGRIHLKKCLQLDPDREEADNIRTMLGL